MHLFETKGMQQILGTLIKQAAPDLVKQVAAFTELVQSFDRRLANVEAMMTEIRNVQTNQIGNPATPLEGGNSENTIGANNDVAN